MIHITIPSLRVLELLADTLMIYSPVDNSPGEFYCPACGEGVRENYEKWKGGNGKVVLNAVEVENIKHHVDCPVVWAKNALAAFKKV